MEDLTFGLCVLVRRPKVLALERSHHPYQQHHETRAALLLVNIFLLLFSLEGFFTCP